MMMLLNTFCLHENLSKYLHLKSGAKINTTGRKWLINHYSRHVDSKSINMMRILYTIYLRTIQDIGGLT